MQRSFWLLVFSSVLFCPSAFAAEPVVSEKNFIEWTKTPFGKKYAALRKVQTVNQMQAEIVSLAKRGMKDESEAVKKELAEFRKLKDPVFVPFMDVGNNIADKQGAIGHLMMDTKLHCVNVTQVIDSRNAIIRYDEQASAFDATSTRPIYFWLADLDTDGLQVKDCVMLDSKLIFMVDGSQDYVAVLGNSKRIPKLTAIEPPKGVYVR